MASSLVEVRFEPASKETTGVETPHGLKKVVGTKNIGTRGLFMKEFGNTALWVTVSELDNMYNRWAVESRITGKRTEIPAAEIEKMLSDTKIPGLHVEGFIKIVAREDIQQLWDFANRLRMHGTENLLSMPPDLFRYIPQLK